MHRVSAHFPLDGLWWTLLRSSSLSRKQPSPTDVQTSIEQPPTCNASRCLPRLLHEELKVGSTSPQLAAMMAATAAKALSLLAERAEYGAASGPELKQLAAAGAGGGPNGAQLRNIALCSQLQEMHR